MTRVTAAKSWRHAAALTALVVASLAAAPAARAAELTGAQLRHLCQDKANTGCSAYVLGFNDAEQGVSPRRFCVPGPASGAALRDTLVAYLEAHKGDLGKPRAALTLDAFRRAFPCGK